MSQLNWPTGIERTDPSERTMGSKFSASLGDTTDEIQTSMERMDVTDYRASHAGQGMGEHNLPRYNAIPDDPGFVLRWSVDGRDHAVACDGYTALGANVREVYLWIEETRKRAKRKARTAQAEFAAAALPSGEAAEADELSAPAPKVLGVQPDAPEAVIQAAFRERVKKAHNDLDGDDVYPVHELKQAREELIG